MSVQPSNRSESWRRYDIVILSMISDSSNGNPFRQWICTINMRILIKVSVTLNMSFYSHFAVSFASSNTRRMIWHFLYIVEKTVTDKKMELYHLLKLVRSGSITNMSIFFIVAGSDLCTNKQSLSNILRILFVRSRH